MCLIAAAVALGAAAAPFQARLQAGEPKETAWERTYALAVEQFQQGRLREAAEMAESLLRIAESDFGPRNPYLAESHLLLGKVADAQLRHTRASQAYEQALGIFLDVTSPGLRPQTLEALQLLAKCYRDQGLLDRAAATYERLLAFIEASAPDDKLALATAASLAADFFLETGQPQRAQALQERVLALQQQVYGADHPIVADTLVVLARIALAQQQLNQAVTLLERGLAIQEHTLGLSHYKVGETLVWMAKTRQLQGRPDEAETLYQRAMLVNGASSNAQPPKQPDASVQASRFYQSPEEPADAQALYERGVQAGGQGPLPDGRQSKPSGSASAQSEAPKADSRVSDEQLKRTIRPAGQGASPTRLAPSDRPTDAAKPSFSRSSVGAGELAETAERFAVMAKSLDARATAYASLGSYDEAETLFKWALEIYERRLGGFSEPEAKTVVEHYADLLKRAGREKEAEELLRGR